MQLLLLAVFCLQAQIDTAFEAWWTAEGRTGREAAAAGILATGAGFEEVAARLRAGRDYGADVPRGMIFEERTGPDGTRFPYMILVPEDYTPERRWRVRWNLHGGMGADEWKDLDGTWTGGWEKIGGIRGRIVVLPAGWWDAMWWEASQVENFEAILDRVKRTWNVDENGIVMYGVSDGCVGCFFYAFRHPDRWAGFAGHVGSPDRLTRADLRADGQMHPSNLAGQRFRVGYGGRDPLNPIEPTRRYMELLEPHCASLDWFVNPRDRHDLDLSAEQEQALAKFITGTRRDPLPDRVDWSTERTDRYARRGWVVIEELALGDEEPDTRNILPRWGSRLQLRAKPPPPQPWGRMQVERTGNRIEARTTGVRRFTLLLSPDELDLARPVELVVDGGPPQRRSFEPSVATLLKWAARDDDRALHYAAEWTVDVD